MTAEQPEKIIVECTSCAGKLRLAASSAGKRFKCPKCGQVNMVPMADPTPVIAEELDFGVPLSQSAGEELQPADCMPPLPALASVPTSQAALEAEGKKQSGGLLEMLRRGNLLRGCVLSGIAAIVGAIAWCVIAVITDYEIGYLAWGVGIATGAMMAFGYQARSTSAGAIAAAFAVFGIILGKVLTVWFVAMPYLDRQLQLQDPRIGRLAAHHMQVESMLRGMHPHDDGTSEIFDNRADALAELSDEELDQQMVELENRELSERDDDPEYVRRALIYYLIAQEVEGRGYSVDRVWQVPLEEWPEKYAATEAKVADMPASEQTRVLADLRAQSAHHDAMTKLVRQRTDKTAIHERLAYADERRGEIYDQEQEAVFAMSEDEFKEAKKEADVWSQGGRWDDPEHTRNYVIYTIIDNRFDEQIAAASDESDYDPYETDGPEWETAWAEAAQEVEGETDQELRERAQEIVAEQEAAARQIMDGTSKAEAIALSTPEVAKDIVTSLDPLDYLFLGLALVSAYGIAARERSVGE